MQKACVHGVVQVITITTLLVVCSLTPRGVVVCWQFLRLAYPVLASLHPPAKVSITPALPPHIPQSAPYVYTSLVCCLGCCATLLCLFPGFAVVVGDAVAVVDGELCSTGAPDDIDTDSDP